MGHSRSPCCAAREILHLLRRAVRRHNIQYQHAAKNSLLHRESHHPLHGHIFLDSPRLLPPVRQRRKSDSQHLHPAVSDCLLLAFSRDHPPDIARSSPSGQVPTIHDDSGHVVHLRDSCGAKRSLPDFLHPQNGSLGEEGVPPDIAQALADAKTIVFGRPEEVYDATRQPWIRFPHQEEQLRG